MNLTDRQLGDATIVGVRPSPTNLTVAQQRDGWLGLALRNQKAEIAVQVDVNTLPELVAILAARSGRDDLAVPGADHPQVSESDLTAELEDMDYENPLARMPLEELVEHLLKRYEIRPRTDTSTGVP